jgi:hypothetical protein
MEAWLLRVRPPWFVLINGVLILAAGAYFGRDLRLVGLAAACFAVFVGSIVRRRMLIERSRRSASANRAVAETLGMRLAIPPANVSPERPLVRPEFVVALVATLVAVTAIGLDRHVDDGVHRWAKRADTYCAGVIAEERRASWNTPVDVGEPANWELSVTAAKRLQRQRRFVAYLHGLETPKGAPADAVFALETLLPYYEQAARRIAAGDRAGYKRVLQSTYPVGYLAHAQLARAGAQLCSQLV